MTSCNYSNQDIDNTNDAKSTVEKIFTYALYDKYDSLRLSMPSDFIRKTNNDYLKIYFRKIKKIAEADGIPNEKELKFKTLDKEFPEAYEIKLIPKSANRLNIDSVKFKFAKQLGLDKVTIMQVFENSKAFDSIKTVPSMTQ